ncbi:LysM peptidoglycan-binding domain-containing protein [Halalkalibacter lacteus]|uniref:LysM peptidoglycan-binding domain-containing protein n=1 Tax=Halalkalibacter lacteus TaxID=3090663 RepID=UPI002FC73A44
MFNVKKNGIKMVALLVGLTAMLGFAHGAAAEMYEVKSGDTLYRIALENKITVDELKQINNLTSNLIFPGQNLQLKDGVIVSYSVKKGDTLYSISRTYKMTVDELKEMNNLTSNLIFPSQKLNVQDANAMHYEVKKGDTLYSISRMYKMTVDELKEMNNVQTNLIFLGKKLAVTKSTAADNRDIKMTVQNGYQFVEEEPRKYQLFANRDPGFFVRVELADSQAELKYLKKNAQQYLQVTGPVHEVTRVQNLHPFYKGSELYMVSSNSDVRQSVVIKKINGHFVVFTLHLLDKEEAEDITPSLLNQLQTIRF